MQNNISISKRPWTIFLTLLICVVLWIWAGWNIDNSDLINYEIQFNFLETYDNLYDDNYGISILFLILKKIGLNFFHTRIVIYGVTLFALFFYILRWSYIPIIVLALYFGFHFVRDVVELKNFLGCVTILYCFNYLAYATWKKRIVAFLLICMAGSFHIAYYLFIPIIFIPVKRTLSAVPFLFIFPIVSFSARLIVNQSLNIYSSEFLVNRIDGLMEYTGYGAIVASTLVVVGSIAFLYYIRNSHRVYNPDIYINHIHFQSYSTVIYNLNIASTFLLVFSSISYSFIGRLYSTIILINIIYITNCLCLKRRSVNVWNLLVFMIYYLCVCMYLSMAEQHYIDVFTNNLIFNK